MTERPNIPISEDFLIRNMTNYDEYEGDMRAIMADQNHVDIRTFGLDSGEEWSVGTYGSGSETNHFHRLSLVINTGSTISSSITPSHSVDLFTGFESTDFISLSLPNFPADVINTVTSFIDFTSNPTGNFEIGPTASVPFNASIVTLVEGNSEFRVPRSTFEISELDLEKITGVRFRITATGSATVILMALRLLGQEWQQGPIDYDNWNGRWINTIPANGNINNPPAFSQPILWRSDNPPGIDDPRPIDSEFGIIINTGNQEGQNSFTLFLREASKAFLTQLDLDGITQSQLDGNPQPDLGVSEFAPRLMSDMDQFHMEGLDLMEMYDIERIPDPVYTGWIEFTFSWGTNRNITVTNSSNPGYVFSEIPTLKNNSRYLLVCTLEGGTARAKLYEMESDYVINPIVVFDTTLIHDDNLFKRRPGRVGWQAIFGDNNAYVDQIQTRHLCFAEYRSAPLTSHTPVMGAQLFANYTQNIELWEGFENGPNNTKEGSFITRDTARSTSGESYRIDNYGAANQGFLSNVLDFTDFAQAEISFDLWYPSALIEEALALSQTPGLRLKLIGAYKTPVIPLFLPEIEPEQWQHISGIDLSIYDLNQTGKYTLLIEQPSAASGSWWIDKFSIFQRAVQWSARSVVDDPWESNYAPWTDFRDLVNTDKSGIMFNVQGKELQMRAKALRQDAQVIQPPKIEPTYRPLGKLVWPENALKGIQGPTANFPMPTNVSGLEYNFKSSSTPGTGAIVLFEWTFGDGNRATGPVVNYTYEKHGTYNATLTVMDRNGLRSQLTTTLIV